MCCSCVSGSDESAETNVCAWRVCWWVRASEQEQYRVMVDASGAEGKVSSGAISLAVNKKFKSQLFLTQIEERCIFGLNNSLVTMLCSGFGWASTQKYVLAWNACFSCHKHDWRCPEVWLKTRSLSLPAKLQMALVYFKKYRFFPSPQTQLEIVPRSPWKHPAVSHLGMLKRRLKLWSLAWQTCRPKLHHFQLHFLTWQSSNKHALWTWCDTFYGIFNTV